MYNFCLMKAFLGNSIMIDDFSEGMLYCIYFVLAIIGIFTARLIAPKWTLRFINSAYSDSLDSSSRFSKGDLLGRVLADLKGTAKFSVFACIGAVAVAIIPIVIFAILIII